MYVIYVPETSGSNVVKYANKLSAISNAVHVVNTPPINDFSIPYLQLDETGLYLISNQFKPINVRDIYTSLANRVKQGLHKDLLIKALKAPNKDATIWDLTAGFGLDAGLMSHAGYQVTMVEKNPILVTVLAYALDNDYLPKQKIQLIYANSIEFLEDRLKQANTNEYPNTIYLDPMFNDNKSAKSKKNMEIIKLLDATIGSSHDSDEILFNLACQIAKDKVVVKRDNKQAAITSKRKTNYSITGRTIRYDVYAAGLI